MCDRDDLSRWAKQGVTRRAFGAGALAGAAVACAPVESDTGIAALTETTVSFRSPDGTMDGEFFHPASGRHPAVLFWPDIGGIRPAKREMARRLAAAGYAVLLANPYYRDAAGQQFSDFADFAGQGGFQKVTPWRERFNGTTIGTDTRAAANWLLRQEAVDASRGIGTQGYCMTGSFAVLGPSVDDRIHAGASFHGGGLVREGAGSPHEQMRTDAHYLVAIAQDDDAKQPGARAALLATADASRASAEIEVYPADHGWCVPDSPSYNQAEAERAWARLLELYKAAL